MCDEKEVNTFCGMVEINAGARGRGKLDVAPKDLPQRLKPELFSFLTALLKPVP
jgi:hypothetical protein